jgi:hypothetical protein
LQNFRISEFQECWNCWNFEGLENFRLQGFVTATGVRRIAEGDARPKSLQF